MTQRRHLLQASLGAAAWAATASVPAWAAPPAPTAADLSKVTLRIGYYKGLWRPLITAAGLGQTPYRIEWRELNNGVLHLANQGVTINQIHNRYEVPASLQRQASGRADKTPCGKSRTEYFAHDL